MRKIFEALAGVCLGLVVILMVSSDVTATEATIYISAAALLYGVCIAVGGATK